MSVYFYDKAIIDRIQKVIDDKNIHIIPPEKMFTKSKDENDNPDLPAISLFRPSFSLSTLHKTITGYRVGYAERDELQNKIFTTKSLPITIQYQLDVWTKTREQNDELVRELLWFFTLYPQHRIEIAYQDYSRYVTFNCFLGDEITDNSEIGEFENRGQYYRQTFNLTVDEAQLFLVVPVPYVSFDVKVQSYDLKGALFDESILTQPHQEGV